MVKELLEKERNQTLAKSAISIIEMRFGKVDDAIKEPLALIQDEDTLLFTPSGCCNRKERRYREKDYCFECIV